MLRSLFRDTTDGYGALRAQVTIQALMAVRYVPLLRSPDLKCDSNHGEFTPHPFEASNDTNDHRLNYESSEE